MTAAVDADLPGSDRDLETARLRVLLADDHDLVREGLRSMLDSFGTLEVVGEAADGREALDAVGECRPDVAVLDITMPELNGVDVTRRIRERWPEVRVLVLSVHADEEHVLEALEAGALGYVQKNADRRVLRDALKALRRGEVFVGPGMPQEVLDSWDRGERRPEVGLARLTPRQREVLQLLAEGHTSRRIAAKLDLSEKTVETHRRNIRKRLEIEDLAGLVRFAVQVGLVPPEP